MIAAPKISITAKLDGIKSWSLQALETCPGSIGNDGKLVDACSGCYATGGNYRFPSVKATRQHNKEDWKNDGWVEAMVAAMQDSRYFRWFDSGDMYSLELAEKILSVMRLTPWVKHWLPTRMFKFVKFHAVIASMQALDNVVVRFSSDSVTGEVVSGTNTSTIAPTPEAHYNGVKVCEAYQHGGKCNGCRACWNKDVNVIGYVAHGAKMNKVIKLKLI